MQLRLDPLGKESAEEMLSALFDEVRNLIYTWFTDGFELPDQRGAKALLDELSR